MKMKNKINGGCGRDDNVSTFYDYIYTARNAWGCLLYPKEGITIFSNQKVQDACKKNVTQFVFPKNKEDIKRIETIATEQYQWSHFHIPRKAKLRKAKLLIGKEPKKLPKEIELDFYWVNEFDWIQKLDWIKEWKINDELGPILIFENDKGVQIRTGLLTL